MNLKTQTGAVLATSLVLLTAITLLAVMGMQRSGLQTKIVANLQHHETAFHAAQSLLEDAYGKILSSDTQVLSNAMDDQAAYQHQVNLGADTTGMSESSPVDFQTPLSNHITPSINLKYKPNGNDLGNPNTSGLRNNFSRGKNGMGIAKFEIDASATLPNQISSKQLLGFHMITPEQ